MTKTIERLRFTVEVSELLAALENGPSYRERLIISSRIAELLKLLGATGEAEPQEAVIAEPDALQIIEHTTGRGKVLRGVVRTDLSYAEAKAIDAYTFKKDGGYFIREKHLDPVAAGLVREAAPVVEKTPEELAKEAEAAAQAEAQKAEAKRAAVVESLRKSGQSTIDKATESLNQGRLTNTHRRASMAANIEERERANVAIGKTMLNIADAVERGEADLLAGLNNRAVVETLHSCLVAAKAKDRITNERERLASRDRGFTPDDIHHAVFPAINLDAPYVGRAALLDALKGKRGASEMAKKIRYANTLSVDEFKLLLRLLDKDAKKAQSIADRNLGWYNVEMAKRAARLQRAGITNGVQLKDALHQYLQVMERPEQESAVSRAMRAIVGAKVGIDFFPTPSSEARRMAQLAEIKHGDLVLEPSAGSGTLADAAKAAGATVEVVEISSQLREILKAKGHNIVADDFMTYTPTVKYDAIIMNPPFGNRMDGAHIERAFGMLKPGGRLVAIAGEGIFFGSDAKAVAFREWLEEHSADIEKLPPGTFKGADLAVQTGANARLLVMRK